MNSKQAVERMREIEANLVCWVSQFDICATNNWDNDGLKCALEIEVHKTKAKEIYEKFKDGCGEREIIDIGEPKYMIDCGFNYFCPNCKKIKEIWEKING